MASSVSSSTSSTSSSTSSTSSSTSTSTSSVTVVALKKRSLVPARWQQAAVRVVGMSECKEAALALAHAFAADDYAKYLVVESDFESGSDAGSDAGDGGMHGGGGQGDDEAAKWKLHVDILTYTVASHVMSGLVTAVGPECDSVALWVPPGKHLDGWWTQLRSGLWRLYYQLSPEGRQRYFQEILPLLHDTKAAVLGARDADAWYLVYLGTRPNSRGRGYAARLLEDMVARADAESRPMYLESSSLANNLYYEKFGFEVKRDVFLERGDVPVRLSIMVREPRVQGCKVVFPGPRAMVKRFAGGKRMMG